MTDSSRFLYWRDFKVPLGRFPDWTGENLLAALNSARWFTRSEWKDYLKENVYSDPVFQDHLKLLEEVGGDLIRPGLSHLTFRPIRQPEKTHDVYVRCDGMEAFFVARS